MVQVKICGIKKEEDAKWAVSLGADMLGFIFYKESPRYISAQLAKKIIKSFPPFVLPVGVFVDEKPDSIIKTVKSCGLKIVQLHGKETPEFCSDLKTILSSFSEVKIIKSFRVQNESILQLRPFCEPMPSADFFLLDAYKEGVPGGTGETFDWELAVKAKEYGPIFLSGGLNPGNIIKAVETVRPYAVDAASGIEADEMAVGRKDYEKMKLFIKRAKSIL
jgi:phosphoribosylanthranilate isomerase